jgi:hypothetical protein
MPKPTKPKTPPKAKPKAKPIDENTTALNAHTKALKQHSTVMTAAATAHKAVENALKNNTAALIATKPQKTLNQKTADATACMSQWLITAKNVPAHDSTNPSKNMATDFHLSSPQEMQLCLEWVQTCLAGKNDIYVLDTSSPNANQHLAKLLTGTLGAVVADIVQNIH